MKMIVIGYSGAGKTVFTEELAKYFKCPVMHIDDLLFTSEFDPRDSAIALKNVEKIMRENAFWIMDGYKDTFTKREWLEEADYIVFLNFSRMICFWRVLKRTCGRVTRTFKNRKNVNIHATEEKFIDTKLEYEAYKIIKRKTIWKKSKIFKSLRWILLDERCLSDGRYYYDVGKDFLEKFIVLQKPKDVDRFKRKIYILSEKHDSAL